MKPLLVDTSVWIDWLRGNRRDLREEARGRIMFMASIVAMELLSGARNRKSYQIISEAMGAFERHQRILLPSFDEYESAGLVLADLGWPASKKSNDVLIAVCARRIGAEVWTCDYSDFAPVGQSLHLSVREIK